MYINNQQEVIRGNPPINNRESDAGAEAIISPRLQISY